MIYNTTLVQNGDQFSFVTESDASDIVSAFQHGESVIVHLVDNNNLYAYFNNEMYLLMVGYESEYENNGETIPENFIFFNGVSDMEFNSNSFELFMVSITENGKLSFVLGGK